MAASPQAESARGANLALFPHKLAPNPTLENLRPRRTNIGHSIKQIVTAYGEPSA
jgi:hypothetical protein